MLRQQNPTPFSPLKYADNIPSSDLLNPYDAQQSAGIWKPEQIVQLTDRFSKLTLSAGTPMPVFFSPEPGTGIGVTRTTDSKQEILVIPLYPPESEFHKAEILFACFDWIALHELGHVAQRSLFQPDQDPSIWPLGVYNKNIPLLPAASYERYVSELANLHEDVSKDSVGEQMLVAWYDLMADAFAIRQLKRQERFLLVQGAVASLGMLDDLYARCGGASPGDQACLLPQIARLNALWSCLTERIEQAYHGGPGPDRGKFEEILAAFEGTRLHPVIDLYLEATVLHQEHEYDEGAEPRPEDARYCVQQRRDVPGQHTLKWGSGGDFEHYLKLASGDYLDILWERSFSRDLISASADPEVRRRLLEEISGRKPGAAFEFLCEQYLKATDEKEKGELLQVLEVYAPDLPASLLTAEDPFVQILERIVKAPDDERRGRTYLKGERTPSNSESESISFLTKLATPETISILFDVVERETRLPLVVEDPYWSPRCYSPSGNRLAKTLHYIEYFSRRPESAPLMLSHLKAIVPMIPEVPHPMRRGLVRIFDCVMEQNREGAEVREITEQLATMVCDTEMPLDAQRCISHLLRNHASEPLLESARPHMHPAVAPEDIWQDKYCFERLQSAYTYTWPPEEPREV